MSTTRVAIAAVGLVMFASLASAQALGDVAKKEESRRKDVKAPAKVYTNEDLRSESGGPAPVPAPAAQAGATGTQPVPSSPSGVQPPKEGDKPATDEPKKDEAYWKARIGKLRDDLGRAQTFADALQSRINALTTDFTARSDPAQRAVIGTDRQKALAELDRVKKEIEANTKAIAGIQDEARKANVPAGWVR
ncbi:MAG TPA: hypothetical protein VKC35_10845 [Vicinamibacterales bacterium]|nr:hypothetical protein [Vicinamibacterales bacterium]